MVSIQFPGSFCNGTEFFMIIFYFNFRPAIVVLLMSMVNEKQPFVLRCAVLYCFQSFLYKNEVSQSQIIQTLLPTAADGKWKQLKVYLCILCDLKSLFLRYQALFFSSGDGDGGKGKVFFLHAILFYFSYWPMKMEKKIVSFPILFKTSSILLHWNICCNSP